MALSDADDEAFERDVRENLFPKVADSAFVMSIVPDEPDVKICLELGAAVFYNKPLVLVCFNGREIPAKLRKIADEVVMVDKDDKADAERVVHAAIGRILAQRGE